MAVGQGWVTKAIIYKAFYRDIDLFFFRDSVKTSPGVRMV